MSFRTFTISALAIVALLFSTSAQARFLQTDPIGYGDGLNWYAYVKNDPLNAIDPSGNECVNNTDKTTTCKTKNYDVTVKTAKNFPGTDPKSDNFHEYDVPAKSPLGETKTREWVKDNPTPGNPDPATTTGTHNDATPVIGSGGEGGISPVVSYVTTNEVSGNEVVVNMTLEGHPLHPGIVVRDTVPNSDGTSTIHNFGEGNGALQKPGSITAGPINSVWKGQTPIKRVPIPPIPCFPHAC